jgi:hypothetical protein
MPAIPSATEDAPDEFAEELHRQEQDADDPVEHPGDDEGEDADDHE